MSVGKFCCREVVVAAPEASVVELAKLMRKHHVGDVVIVEQAAGQPMPLGLITDRDLVVEIIAQEVNDDSVSARDIMCTDLLTAREEESLWDALQKMRNKGVRRLVVVNNANGLEGILAVDDVLELLADEMNMLARVAGRSREKERERRC